MDTITMNAMSEKLGIKLTVRDNDKLIDETVDKLLPKMMRKVKAAGVCTASDEDRDMKIAQANDDFYSRGNKVD